MTTDSAPRSHETHVADQFGPQAAAYVASAVHAAGEDLAEIAARMRAEPAGDVLDLGSGGGHVAFAVAEAARRVTAYDLSADMLGAVAAEARRRGLVNIETRRGAAESLPFGDASFDAVLTRFSAHHWADVPAALAEARRVVRPGGRLIVADLIAPEAPILDTHLQAVELLRDPSHARDYTASEWGAMLRAAGFDAEPPVLRRLRLDFASWIARMRTPATHVAAIRSLQAGASEAVRRHFAIEPDGTFTADTMTVSARAGAPGR
ncbi:class I SAM-dependent methyltransferase [Methylobacterium planeticum]|uniref:Class I SAM-dependent methyltransferase n=1 Tax=Methylobacterium planeticum TaxID=2615211 RepID=A0A6N6MQI5_9HYPH|nr:methyltransferase domain-containing protein [Methylobacterium planeticum]KAB1073924.1 class I SAM-dependent methyltransferase [Methylobacterium planeticum]